MITKKIYLKVQPVHSDLLAMRELPAGLVGSLGTGPTYNAARFNIEASDKDFPPEFWALGSGYDVFGEYAYGGSTKQTLFNWERASLIKKSGYDVPDVVSVNEVNTALTHIFSGYSAYELQENLKASIDVSGGDAKGLFSGSLHTEFGYESLRQERHMFSIVERNVPLWKFSFDPNSSKARALLDQDFIDALKSYDPYEFFRTYGTHFINEMMIGGRMHYSSSTDQMSFKSKLNFGVTAKASFDSLFGSGDASANVDFRQAVNSFRSSSQSNLIVVGGDSTKAFLIGEQNSPGVNDQYYREWVSSIKSDMSFMAFGSKNSLSPIWTLESDSSRRNLLQDAMQAFLRETGKNSALYSDSIVDVTIVAGKSSGVPAPQGYEKYQYDLNKGSGGSFIYLCFAKKGKDEIKSSKLRAVTDLAVIFDKDPVPAGYEKIPVDLNQGAHGKFIYLCKKYGLPGEYENTIRDIVIVGGRSSFVAPPYGYQEIMKDLNAGAKGEYIYLCYTK